MLSVLSYRSLIVESILLEREEESTIFVTFRWVRLLKLFATNVMKTRFAVHGPEVWLDGGLVDSHDQPVIDEYVT